MLLTNENNNTLAGHLGFVGAEYLSELAQSQFTADSVM
ncbi:hypothetical protein FEDK69T_18830 [Flavobacterium enshiense DK69]|nr:hypothetical protein FEDK69T_18830 [Flavobacterium enshiense DK69]